MLASTYRLRKKEVERIYKKGHFLSQNFLNLRFLENRTNHFRFAIVIPKTVAKLATSRNRLKRKTSVVLENLLPHLSGHLDCMIIFKKAPDEIELEPVFTKLFQDSRIK